MSPRSWAFSTIYIYIEIDRDKDKNRTSLCRLQSLSKKKRKLGTLYTFNLTNTHIIHLYTYLHSSSYIHPATLSSYIHLATFIQLHYPATFIHIHHPATFIHLHSSTYIHPPTFIHLHSSTYIHPANLPLLPNLQTIPQHPHSRSLMASFLCSTSLSLESCIDVTGRFIS